MTWVDVNAFEQTSASATLDGLTKAIELYQGMLLPDDPYSDALAARREGRRQRSRPRAASPRKVARTKRDGSSRVSGPPDARS